MDAVDLATRKAGSIEVALIWDRREKTLCVFAYDAMTGEEFVVPVNRAEAGEVYRHPFAYSSRATTSTRGLVRQRARARLAREAR
jgi:hypothetical protein